MIKHIEALNAKAFSAFGDVIEIGDHTPHFTINDGYTERYDDLARIMTSEQEGRTGVSIFRSTPLPSPINIISMERHPLSTQAFMPLSFVPYLVVVAPAGDFDESGISVFLASANQGVNYHEGTWHHFCLALQKTSDFLVIDRIGSGPNCDVIDLEKPLIIDTQSLTASNED